MSTFVDELLHTAVMTDGSNANPFGNWLLAEISRRGWERSEFARRVDVPRATVSRWINGSRIPTPEKCADLADALGLAPEYVLWKAGHLEQLPAPPADYDAVREVGELRRMLDAGVRRVEEAYASTDMMLRIRVVGIVPADSVRWTSVGNERRAVRIPREWVAGAKLPLIAVEVSGDCLLSRGIADGDTVICERPTNPQNATNGDVVIVRVGDEYAMKVWHRTGDHIELRTGDGDVVHRLSIVDDYEVIGVYLLRVGTRRGRLPVEEW